MLVQFLILSITCLLTYFYCLHKNIKDHFKNNGICFVPGVPIFGNSFKSALLRCHFIEDLDAVYKAFPDEKYVGYIEGAKPLILVRDPELMKLITVKDFNHFVDHKAFFTDEVDPLLNDSLFSLKGEKWREMRNLLSPAFTSSKMRLMMPHILAIGNNTVEYLKGHNSQTVDVESVVQRYTNDVMASAGFGLELNSFVDKSNQFYAAARDTVTFPFSKSLYYFIVMQFPIIAKVFKFFGVRVIPNKCSDFFRDAVATVIHHRRKHNIVRNDLLQMMLDIADEWTINEIAGQIYLTFLAGFESTGSTLILCLHELAVNPEAQEKLYQEIKRNQEMKGGLTHESMSELRYLDAVLNETLRKWSPALGLDRVCTKPYEMPPPRVGGSPYHLKKGDVVYNMVDSVQRDSKYFPEPDVFNPDRFCEQNKHSVAPFTFMPFGVGPRNCIGLRYATMLMKVLIYNVVLNFKVLKCEQTTDPIRLQPEIFIIRAVGGTWVRLETRA